MHPKVWKSGKNIVILVWKSGKIKKNIFRKVAMIQRELDQLIENHYKQSSSALLLTGARQVGKTIAIRKYAQKAGLELIEINFYDDPSASNIFIGAQNEREVLLRLSAHTRQRLQPGRTLIFLDEVQKYPDVITWVKFLVDEGNYRYALSGSLLGVQLKDIRSVPVGSMAVKEVYPLTLEEFARARGVSDVVLQSIRMAWEECKPVDPVVHQSMMKVMNLYLLVGGMPAVVQTYIDTNDMQAVRAKQEEILTLYHWDIAQYDPENKLYIDEIFDLIPSELNAKNKRFVLKNLNEHSKFSRHENGFIWLRDAGVALPTYNVSEPVTPLRLSESRSLFKLFQNDVGLLAAQYADGIAMKLLTGEVNINYGAIYENAVAQELRAHGWNLYYYNSKKHGEVDFLLENDSEVIPLEVKSGKDYDRHRALNNIFDVKEFGIKQAVVLCNDNLQVKGQITYAPIYMLMFIRRTKNAEPMIYKPDISAIQ